MVTIRDSFGEKQTAPTQWNTIQPQSETEQAGRGGNRNHTNRVTGAIFKTRQVRAKERMYQGVWDHGNIPQKTIKPDLPQWILMRQSRGDRG